MCKHTWVYAASPQWPAPQAASMCVQLAVLINHAVLKLSQRAHSRARRCVPGVLTRRAFLLMEAERRTIQGSDEWWKVDLGVHKWRRASFRTPESAE